MAENNDELLAELEKERRILVVMRKTLSQVVREVTPSSRALQSPLSKSSVTDIKMCFGLIAARERELAERAGISLNEVPRYSDEVNKTNVISMRSIKKAGDE